MIEVPVAWGDMDAYQHVNNTMYFRWFEDGRIAYFAKVGIHELKEATGIAPILSATQCRFRLPLSFPDTVSIGTRVSEVLEDRFTMKYVVVSHRHGKVAAEGEGTCVAFDYRALAKAAYPEALRQRIEALEGARRR